MRLAGLGLALGFIMMTVAEIPKRWRWIAVPITSIAIYLPIYYAFRDFWFQDIQVSASRLAILYYDFPQQVFTVGIPFAITIALGGHAQRVYQSISAWIGYPEYAKTRERTGWLAGMLMYTMLLSAMMGVMAMFSAHVDLNVAIAWAVWGAITFTFAVAAWQWRLWGMRGLILSAIAAICGGLWFDLQLINTARIAGDTIAIFEPAAQLVWFTWIPVGAVLLWGVWNRKLWSAIGLTSLIGVWFILTFFTEVQTSGAALGATSFGLLLYALLPEMMAVRKKKVSPMEAESIGEAVADAPIKDQPAVDPDLIQTAPKIQQPDLAELDGTEVDIQEAAKDQWDAPDPLIMSEVQQVTVDSGKVEHYDPDDALKTTDVRQILVKHQDDIMTEPKIELDTELLKKDDAQTTPKIDLAAEAADPPEKPLTINIDTSSVKGEAKTTPKIDLAAESADPPEKPPTINIDTSSLKRNSDEEYEG